MTNPLSPDLIAWGAVYTPAQVAPGQAYWKLIMADGPQIIGGNHHVFIDLWDENGDRAVGVPVIYYSHKEQWPMSSEAKPGEPSALNLPMYAGGNAYGIYVNDGLPSDRVFGFGLGSFVDHHSFRGTFQRTIATGAEIPIEPPTTPPTMTLREVIEQAQHYLSIALKLTGEN